MPIEAWGEGDKSKRRPCAASFTGPGPAAYKLPSATGMYNADPRMRASSAYSIGARRRTDQSNQSPGPKYAIKQSLTTRGPGRIRGGDIGTKSKGFTNVTSPGPKYDASKLPNKKDAPAYSMRTRPGGVRAGVLGPAGPGPDAYTLPTLTGENVRVKQSAPAITFGMRSEVGSALAANRCSPGPIYNASTARTKTLRSAPAYAMSHRTYISKSVGAPGPKYNPPTPYRNKPPAYSFGSRHSQYSVNVMPSRIMQ